MSAVASLATKGFLFQIVNQCIRKFLVNIIETISVSCKCRALNNNSIKNYKRKYISFQNHTFGNKRPGPPVELIISTSIIFAEESPQSSPSLYLNGTHLQYNYHLQISSNKKHIHILFFWLQIFESILVGLNNIFLM